MFVYNVEVDIPTGMQYELAEIEVLEETATHYVLKHYADLRKEEAHVTPESAIEAYYDKLIEALVSRKAKVVDAEVELAKFERCFIAKLYTEET